MSNISNFRVSVMLSEDQVFDLSSKEYCQNFERYQNFERMCVYQIFSNTKRTQDAWLVTNMNDVLFFEDYGREQEWFSKSIKPKVYVLKNDSDLKKGNLKDLLKHWIASDDKQGIINEMTRVCIS